MARGLLALGGCALGGWRGIAQINCLWRCHDNIFATPTIGEPCIVNWMFNRMQAGACSKHPARKNALHLGLRVDFINFNEARCLRRFGWWARVANTRRDLDRAKLHSLIHRDIECDDAPGDLVETGKDSGRMFDLIGLRNAHPARESRSREKKTHI